MDPCSSPLVFSISCCLFVSWTGRSEPVWSHKGPHNWLPLVFKRVPPHLSQVVVCSVLIWTGSKGSPVLQEYCGSKHAMQGGLVAVSLAAVRHLPYEIPPYGASRPAVTPLHVSPTVLYLLPRAHTWRFLCRVLPSTSGKGPKLVQPYLAGERMRRGSMVEQGFLYPVEEEEGEIPSALRAVAVTLGCFPQTHPSFLLSKGY